MTTIAIRPMKGDEYKSVLENGTRHKSGDLVAYFLPTASPEIVLGLSVGRKFGSAVERNRIKRQIRALCRTFCQNRKSGFKIVIIIRPALKGCSKSDLKNHFLNLITSQNQCE